jgi:hypothetical protein
VKARGQSAAQIRRRRYAPNSYMPDRVYISDLGDFGDSKVKEEAETSHDSFALMAKAPVHSFQAKDVVRLARVKELL